MPAGSYNIAIEQGATFKIRFTWKDDAGDPRDLTNYKARMHVRLQVGSPDPPLLDLASDGPDPELVLGGTAGTIDLTLTDEQTAALTFTTGYYDLELEHTTTGEVTRLLKGMVTVDPEVTR